MNNEIKEILDNVRKCCDIMKDNNFVVYQKQDILQLLDYISNLQQIEQEHKKINGELREENSKLEIALQNIQEDYDRRVKEIDVLKKKLDRRYYKNEYERLKQENERLKKNQRLSPEERQHFHLDVDEIYEILIDYKIRCEKAIDKIQYIIDYGFDYDGFNTVESLKGLIDMLVDYARESKNILQGENNE